MLSNLPAFTDLYLPKSRPILGHMFPGPLPIPESMHELVSSLMEEIRKLDTHGEGSPDFAIRVGNTPYRVLRLPAFSDDYYVLRRMPERIWTLTECGFSGEVQRYLLHERLCAGGIIIVSGMPGNGKSTTLAALTTERLRRFGGVALTVEDPIEMPMEGIHGQGLCLQRSVRSEDQFHAAVRETLRGYPAQANNILMIGEVRDPHTAAIALRAALDGRLVLVSMHGGDVIKTIQRLISLASRLMGIDEARQVLGGAFRAVIQQRINRKTVQTEDGKEVVKGLLTYNILLDTEKAASTIRHPKTLLSLLGDELKFQHSALRRRQPLHLRDIG